MPFEHITKGRLLGSVVVFGDWCFAKAQTPLPSMLEKEANLVGGPFCHLSVMIGLRKVIKALPLKVNTFVTEHGTKGLIFDFGHDF